MIKSEVEKVTPLLCATNNTVIYINAAHAFIFIVVHKGTLNEATSLRTFKLFSTQCMVVGIVAEELFEKNAVIKAGIIPFRELITGIPLNLKKSGSTTTACNIFATTMVNM